MTTPTATGRTPIKLTDPAQLLAALPYLLGFVPEDSVVLLGHRPPGTRIGLTLRADLPPRSKRRQQAEALAPRMAATLHTGVTVIVAESPSGNEVSIAIFTPAASQLAVDGA